MAKRLRIVSPKRNKRLQTGWEGFFPYYAGYPELFARELLQSAKLSRGAVVLDPWNGSGTTTYTATSLGLNAIGIDLNPVMIIVARTRLLPPSESDHLRPLAATISASQADVARDFGSNVRGTTAALLEKREADLRLKKVPHPGDCKVSLSDTVVTDIDADSVDFVLTSPPYCTRIDYTAATRIELAVLAPLLKTAERTRSRTERSWRRRQPEGELHDPKITAVSTKSYDVALQSTLPSLPLDWSSFTVTP